MIIQCFYLSCQATVEVDVDEAAQAAESATAPCAVGGFLARDKHRLPGKPWLCPYHQAMTEATRGLSRNEEQQRQALLNLLCTGRMTKGENGWYSQVPPKPVKPYTIAEDDGTIRTTTVKWWTPEQVASHLNGELRLVRGKPYPLPPDFDDTDESNGAA
jgi:hypothetical protein